MAQELDTLVPDLRWGVEVAPQSAAAHERLGDALLQGGDNTGARAAFTETLPLDPTYTAVRDKLAHVPN